MKCVVGCDVKRLLHIGLPFALHCVGSYDLGLMGLMDCNFMSLIPKHCTSNENIYRNFKLYVVYLMNTKDKNINFDLHLISI